MNNYDFNVSNHGSIYVLTAITEDAVQWATDHLPDDAPQWEGGVAIEANYLWAILEGIDADGLTVNS